MMSRVNVIYHHFPHYRRPVLRELVQARRHEYRFFGSLAPVEGIETFGGDELVTIHPLSFRMRGRTWVLRGYLAALLDPSADALIVHGHPNMPASWIIGLVGRLTGKKVLYWAHGWLRREAWPGALVRRLHYSLGHRTMTYAERARGLAADIGFNPDKIVPIYNSLDWRASQATFDALRKEGIAAIRARLGIAPGTFRISCVARLTRACRFDQLLDAAAQLLDSGRHVQVCLIGAGPEEAALRRQAERLGVDLALLGDVYDERTLGEQIYVADLTVSPGKVGLSAIHSLTYGTPVVTHGDLDHQMPEVEAIIPGVNGSLFERDDVAALIAAIRSWMIEPAEREAVRYRCIAVVAERYNPIKQAELIDATVSAACAR